MAEKSKKEKRRKVTPRAKPVVATSLAKRSRGRPPNPLDRDQVLHVAAKLFVRKGYIETTMQDIARQLGVSKPTLYAYAEGKSHILQDIIRHWMRSAEEILDRVENQPDRTARFELLVRGWTEIAVENAEVFKVFLAEERDLPRSFVNGYRRWSDTAYKRIIGMFLDNQKSGAFAADLEPTVSTFVFVAFFNLLPRWYSDEGRLSVDDVADSFLLIMQRAFAARGVADAAAPPRTAGDA